MEAYIAAMQFVDMPRLNCIEASKPESTLNAAFELAAHRKVRRTLDAISDQECGLAPKVSISNAVKPALV